ncbi:MAG TPA: T9SS type A sorting domain-containing protein, partial [Bacteroidia bacterium]|nr:T9SS type A sorting domain-containing protein [Bacteroidia bacterium]
FPENERLVAQLFDINGKMLMQNELTTGVNTIETSFHVSSLPKAIYLIRLGNDHIQRVVKTPIN